MSRFSHYEACPVCRTHGRDTRGDNLGVYQDGSKHCFSCGYHKGISVSSLFNPVNKGNNVNKDLLPFDFTREVPATAWKWLLQYGLPYSYWKDSTGYSPKAQRLVFCVGSPTQFSIGRYIGAEKERKWYVWGDSHKHVEVINKGTTDKLEKVVLTEDLISAHKVGQIAIGIPLFGTAVPNAHLYYLKQQSLPITLWLDKDQEHSVKKKAMWLQQMINHPVDIVITDDDPKKLTINSIKEILT
jgi:hypothetical protein